MKLSQFKEWATFDFLTAGGLLLVVMLLSLATTSVLASGKVDFCYIEMPQERAGAGSYKVFGHVPWRGDQLLGVKTSPEEAHKLMLEICPVKGDQR
mgnify:FL=1